MDNLKGKTVPEEVMKVINEEMRIAKGRARGIRLAET